MPGYNHVCALADKLVMVGLPLSVNDVLQFQTLSDSLISADKFPKFKMPATTLMTQKHRTNRKNSATPGVDSTKRWV